MPSVGMRRTTRVFGVVKGVDGARVLRSGRRLWPESGDAKVRKGSDRDEWFSLIDSRGGSGNGVVGGLKSKQVGLAKNASPKREIAVIEIEDDECEKPVVETESLIGRDDVDRMSGIVYSRKRKRETVSSLEIGDGKKYGIRFSRRQNRKSGGAQGEFLQGFRALSVVLELPCRENWAVVGLLCSVLQYMKRVCIRLSALSKFVMSEPLRGVYALHGIHFSRECPSIFSSGTCKFFGSRQFTPIFCVDFSAVPFCFMYMHCSMLLRHQFVPLAPVNNSALVQTNDGLVTADEEELSEEDYSFSPSKSKSAGNVEVPGSELLLHMSSKGAKVDNRSSLHRYGSNSRGIRKRRSSLRPRRRARNPSLACVRKCIGALASDLVSAKKNGFPFSSIISSNKRRSVQTRSAGNNDETSATVTRLQQDTDMFSCNANVLISDSDKCFREDGGNVMLELLDSGEWSLVVKIGGLIRYAHKAQEVMRPCSSNHFTHAMVWIGDNDWKLEFPDRDDWLKFKDLYKECFDRNKQVISPKAPSVKIIPVPGVCEVLGYGEENFVPFTRPEYYITVSAGEVSRAMASKTASYDMDCEDEEWLHKFNNEFFAENDPPEHVSEDSFELMIDAFEKAFYCNPYDLLNEKPDPNLRLDIEREDVVEAVNRYWVKKRMQRRSALVRVFQGHQSRKAPLVPKPALRKRRSFKRQGSQHGRGKQPGLLQALAAERDALEEQSALRKVEEAQASADRSLELAIAKRQRAQSLMGNADLAAYRATMALRIAESAQVAGSPDAAAAHFLD
ncbi:uncharacterized protein LOC115751798 isoform X1 [Rhodamnia argentea]|uniref:Enhancer of polycomb-like protein n=1 Tax=Rhodamnia argentea TaxID=178133 RepID=A0A8B8QEX2_9MYRT|nr:uncharacterized protein LOC115751798 isoform X1 [Rhodamnia argentea]